MRFSTSFGSAVHLAQHELPAVPQHGHGGGDEVDARADHLIAGLKVEAPHRHLQPDAGGADGDRVVGAAVGGELPLEDMELIGDEAEPH